MNFLVHTYAMGTAKEHKNGCYFLLVLDYLEFGFSK
jgi:hypothetical protein